MKVVGLVLAAVLACAVVAVVAVVAVDAWRASGVRPPPCDASLLEPARGELRDDEQMQAAAWSALTDPDADTIGELDGSRPVLARTCLVYAGRIGNDARPTAVFLETTVTGSTSLLRVAEVRPGVDGRPALRAVIGYPTLIGSELSAGVVLPLSGRYFAPDDVEAVSVLGPAGGRGTPATAVADGVFDLGAVPDRSLAPVDRVADTPVTLVAQRKTVAGATMIVVPVVPQPQGDPLRIPLRVVIDDRRSADEATLAAVASVMPLFFADPRLPALLERAPGYPGIAVRTAVIPGGRGVVVGTGDDLNTAGLPIFQYFVPTVGTAVAVGS